MTTKTYLSVIFLCFIFTHYTYGQMLSYAYGTGGNGEDQGERVTTDLSGNVFTTGYFSGTVDFQQDLSGSSVELSSAGNTDIYLAKYSPTGDILWAHAIGGNGSDEGKSVFTDAAGNVYVTGVFRQTVDFDPSGSTFNITSYGPGSSDVFLAKYNANGGFVWAKKMGSSSLDIGYGLVLDNAGNVIVTGYFTGTADFDEGGAAANLVSVGDFDLFIAKYEPDGDLIWAKGVGSTGQETGFGIDVDGSDNIYVTGRFAGTTDFNPDPGATFDVTSNGDRDIFLAKYQSDGTFVWAKGIGGTAEDWGFDLVVDASANIYLTGHFTNSADFDPNGGVATLTSAGSRDAFIAKYNTNGVYDWAHALGGTSSADFGYSLTLNSEEEPIVCGYFSNTVDFDPSTCEFLLTSAGGQDTYFANYDRNGLFRWAHQIGGATNEESLSIVLDPTGQFLYLTGYFTGTANFSLNGTVNLSSSGDRDVFLARYDLSSLATIDFDISINLQGPYTVPAGNMNDALRPALIPDKEPYTGLGFTVSQNSARCLEPDVLSAQATSDDDIVDWIYVELRSDINTFLTSKAGLLKRDGTIVDPDGSPLSIVVSAGNYHVLVAHRNHLPIITVEAIPVSN